MGELKKLGALRALQTVIVNGQPLKKDVMQYIIQSAQPVAHHWIPNWISLAYAAGMPLSDSTPVAELVDKRVPLSMVGSGLRRIHAVESELDDVIPDVRMAKANVPEDTADNFIGEFTVQAGAPVKAH